MMMTTTTTTMMMMMIVVRMKNIARSGNNGEALRITKLEEQYRISDEYLVRGKRFHVTNGKWCATTICFSL